MSASTDTLKSVFRLLLAILVSLLLYIGAWFAVDVRWYLDLRSVTISAPVATEAIPIVVSRDIHTDFNGGYSVTIREQPTNHVFCTSGDVAVPYRSETDPVAGKDLAWWAFGGDCTDRIAPGLPAGDYTIETCHYVSRPLLILPSKRRCVLSGVFTVWGEELPLPIQRQIDGLERQINQLQSEG